MKLLVVLLACAVSVVGCSSVKSDVKKAVVAAEVACTAVDALPEGSDKDKALVACVYIRQAAPLVKELTDK